MTTDGKQIDYYTAKVTAIAWLNQPVPTPKSFQNLARCYLAILARVELLESQLDAEEKDAMHSGGILSDVCDVLFASETRAMDHGYHGAVERARLAMSLLAEVLPLLPHHDGYFNRLRPRIRAVLNGD